MIQGVIVKKLSKLEDERGWLMEMWRSDESEHYPAMAYVSVTKPGVIRGPHEHTVQSDGFIFAGPGEFEIFLWDRRSGSATPGESMIIPAGASDPKLIIVPPGVVHGYKCVSAGDGYSINLPNRLYQGKDKKEEIDEIRWEDDPKSLYIIN